METSNFRKTALCVSLLAVASFAGSVALLPTEPGVREFEGLQECPKGSDSVLSTCFTQVFHDLQPQLADGIPELGILSLEPLHIPKLPLTIIDNRLAKLVMFLRDVRVNGMAAASRLDFTVHTGKQEVDFDFVYPQLLVNGAARLDGHLLGVLPISAVTGDGSMDWKLDDWTVQGTFYLTQIQSVNDTKRSLRIADFKVTDHNCKLFRTESTMLLRPRWFERVANSVQNRSVQLFNVFVKDSLLAKLGAVVPGFMNPIFTNALVAEYFGEPEGPQSLDEEKK